MQPLPPMPLTPPVVTLLTDFGVHDYYVAAVKGTVLRLAPGTQLVDISHDVAPGDIAAASFLLAAAAPAFPPGTVHLAVVDPGVGSRRRILAAETAAGLVVAPDNGLLTPLLEGSRVHAVERQDLFLAAPGATFHGRDRFGPVAAFLARGGALADLGPEIGDAVRLDRLPPRREPHLLAGVVVHIDRYGNLITNIPAAWLPNAAAAVADPMSEAAAVQTAAAPDPTAVPAASPAAATAGASVPSYTAAAGSAAPRLVARVGSHTASLLAGHYEEIPRYEVALLVGSLGTLELALRGEDLSRRWGVTAGAAVQVRWR
jgi:S-adenosylmethionine hydrolase